MQTLTLKIDGKFEPEDFVDILEAIESLYYKATDHRRRFYLPELYYFERRASSQSYADRLDAANQWLLKEARMTTYGENRLFVSRITYASPGGMDFTGIGKALEAIERVIGRLIDFFTERHKRRETDKQATLDTHIKEIEVEKERETLRAIQIENARELLALRRDFPDELQEILLPLAVQDQERISNQIAEGRLIGVERKIEDEE